MNQTINEKIVNLGGGNSIHITDNPRGDHNIVIHTRGDSGSTTVYVTMTDEQLADLKSKL